MKSEIGADIDITALLASVPEEHHPLIRALLASAPPEPLLRDQQVYEWLGIPLGTQAAQRNLGGGFLADCTIYLGPRTPRVVKSELVKKIPQLLGKRWIGGQA